MRACVRASMCLHERKKKESKSLPTWRKCVAGELETLF